MKRFTLLRFALLALVPFLLYLGTTRFDFTYFDDDQLILENAKAFEAPFTWGQYFLTGADVGTASVYYRPLQNLSYHLDTQWAGGMDPMFFHLSNVLLFSLLICLLFYFLYKIGIQEKWAFALALLYAVHPVNVCAVAWIPARGDLLLGIFTLIAFLAYLAFMKTLQWRYAIGAALAFGMALLSKETAAILPFLFLLHYVCFVREKRLKCKHWILALMLLVVGLCWFYLRTSNVIHNDHLSWRVFVSNFPHFTAALAQWTVPYYWSTLPVYTTLNTTIGGLVLCAIGYLVYRSRNRRMYFGVGWFVLFMLPLFLVLPCDFDFLEHRFLLPLMGVLIIIGLSVPEDYTPSRNVMGVYAGLLLCCIVLSYIKAQNYTDPERFYGQAIEYHPAGLPYQNRGLYRQNRGDLQGALEDYNAAVRVEPKSITAPLTRGIIKGMMGDYAGGIEDINRSIALADTSYDQYFQRAFLKEKLLDFSGALADYNRAIEMKQDFYLAYNNRGSIYEKLNKNEDALRDFLSSIRLYPQYAEAYSNVALMYFRAGNYALATDYLHRAIEHAPDEASRQIYQSRLRIVRNKLLEYKP